MSNDFKLKIYPNDDSALKMVYMAIREASRKWTLPIHHWKEAFNYFAILTGTNR